jgi:hypothetical protein
MWNMSTEQLKIIREKGRRIIGFCKEHETLRPGFPPKKKGGAQRYGINLKSKRVSVVEMIEVQPHNKMFF